MPLPMAIANWKMNQTYQDGIILASLTVTGLLDGVRPNVDSVVGLAVPFPLMTAVQQAVLDGTGIELIAQNCHEETSGAFTGEVSIPMLVSVGVKRVILGHSERRKHYGEDDALVAKKLRAVLDNGLGAILCVGERDEQREAGEQQTVVEAQVRAALEGLSAGQLESVTVAYEPVWAIGTGKNATPEQAGEMHTFIRDLLTKLGATDPRVIYGGSVKPDNVGGLAETPGVDGVLVGGASLEAISFVQIVRACVQAGRAE